MSPKHDWPKDRAQAAHFKTRLRERYGIEINRHEYAELCASVNGTPIVERKSERITVRRVRVRGQWIMCAYDSKRHRLVSALPPRNREEGKDA